MTAVDVAVLSYHGWEIDPSRLVDDVQALRSQGWRDVSLDHLQALLDGRATPSQRAFHVTIDDGAEADRDCVAALRGVSCAATLFLSLETMTPAANTVQKELASWPDVSLQDHSLRHNRTFHYRHLVGFHSSERPLTNSADRMGLRRGDPVCSYGGELVRPRFMPAPQAIDLCRATAEKESDLPAGSAEWSRAILNRLLGAGLAWRRFGRVCIAGQYESAGEFGRRVRKYLEEGRDRLLAFSGRTPYAFAHPWWDGSPVADAHLRALGYTLTFSGRGPCRRRSSFGVPRLFVSNATPRPLNVRAIAASDAAQMTERWGRLRHAGRRLVFA